MGTIQYPTYLLAPNWSFRPGGRIEIGNVIVDPLMPHRALVRADTEKPLQTEATSETNYQLSVERVQSFGVNSLSLCIWAIFHDKIALKVGATHTHVKNAQYKMQSLDTVTLKEEPSDEYIGILCKNPKVRNIMKPGRLLHKPVYLVTGLKIARGFSMFGVESHSTDLVAEATGSLAQSASIGTSVGASSKTWVSGQSESDGDIIFAYQLMMIKPKSWTRDQKIVTSDYRTGALLEGDEPEGSDEDEGTVEFERGVVDAEDLSEQNKEVEKLEVQVTDIGSVNIVYRDR